MQLRLFALAAAAVLLLAPLKQASGAPVAPQVAGGTAEPVLSDERVVLQTSHGDIEFGFLPDVAPVTAQHIFKLATLGAYTGNHIFRVDKGFVAQVADVVGGRNVKMNRAQQVEAEKRVPLEVKPNVKHVEGVLSMGRYDDPNSGTSSFSMLLGPAPHLDLQYTIFGKITSGMDVLRKLELLETRQEGIFVMPKERVHIQATYWYNVKQPPVLGALATGGANATYCQQLGDELEKLRSVWDWTTQELHRVRQKCLPGTRR